MIQLNIYILLLSIIEIIMGLVIIILTIFIECSESNKAINDFDFSNNSRRKELEKLAKLSVYDQVIVWLHFILPLLFLLSLMILMI